MDQQLISAYTNAYNAARNEIVERIKLRDQCLLLYLGGIATLYSIGVGKDKMREILYIIPFLSVGVSTIVSHHNITIGEIASFIRKDLKNYFGDVCHWDKSSALRKIFKVQSLYRKISALIIIGVPPIIALVINANQALETTFPFGLLWWLCCVMTLFAIYYIYYANSHRDRIYGHHFRRRSLGKETEEAT